MGIVPLGRERKKIGLLIIIVGLLTFFLPIVRLNPPLMNRSQWSPLDIASGLFRRALPVPGGRFDESLVEIFSLYGLMACAIPAALFFRSPQTLRVISGMGTGVSFFGKFWEHGFLNTFGWSYFGSAHLERGATWWLLPFIMPALLGICFAGFLDS